jgi:sucrose-6-phosphate hydrolase SacC (GH32 family)
VDAELVELRAEFETEAASELLFTVRGAKIMYDGNNQQILVNDHRAPAPLRNGKLSLLIYCDRMGLEVFASDGLTYIPMPFVPKSADRTLAVQARGGSARINVLQVHELRSAWQEH